MSDYRIFETDQFQKDLRHISRAGHAGLTAKLRRGVYPSLRQRPRFGPHIRKLRGYSPETWRYRVGRWRFFYEVDDEQRIIFMTAASHRGSAY